MVNLYEILEINNFSSINEIKMAYRHLSKKYHPDSNSENSNHDKFIEINKVYQILTNPYLKNEYDHRLKFKDIDSSTQWNTTNRYENLKKKKQEKEQYENESFLEKYKNEITKVPFSYRLLLLIMILLYCVQAFVNQVLSQNHLIAIIPCFGAITCILYLWNLLYKRMIFNNLISNKAIENGVGHLNIKILGATLFLIFGTFYFIQFFWKYSLTHYPYYVNGIIIEDQSYQSKQIMYTFENKTYIKDIDDTYDLNKKVIVKISTLNPNIYEIQ